MDWEIEGIETMWMQSYGASFFIGKVALIIPKEEEKEGGFEEWFEFLATDFGLTSKGVITYNSTQEIERVIEGVIERGCEAMVAMPISNKEAAELINAYNRVCKKEQHGERLMPTLWIGSEAYSSEVIKQMEPIDNSVPIKGVARVPSPLSGFTKSFEAKVKRRPHAREAELFDAVMIACYAYWYGEHNKWWENLENLESNTENNKRKNSLFNEAIAKLVEGKTKMQGGWTTGRIEETMERIARGETPIISGATGGLEFYPKVSSFIKHSTFVYWQLYENKMIDLEYYCQEEGDETISHIKTWERERAEMEQWDEEQENREYPPLKGQWAVIIAASKGWRNYRHQADVLELYHQLRENGFKEEQIVVVMEDDIAYHKQNK